MDNVYLISVLRCVLVTSVLHFLNTMCPVQPGRSCAQILAINLSLVGSFEDSTFKLRPRPQSKGFAKDMTKQCTCKCKDNKTCRAKAAAVSNELKKDVLSGERR